MSDPVPARSTQEVPVFFPAGNQTLFGILTRPVGSPNGTALIILAGGATPVTTNRNRLSVRLCRRVAGHGFHAMRLDYHGAGESTGIVEVMHLNRPFTTDPEGAMQWLRGQGIKDFVLVGSCFGSRTALAAAAANPDVTRLVLVAPPVKDMAFGDWASVQAAHEWSFWKYLRRALRLSVLRGLFDRHHRLNYWRYIRHKWAALRRRRSHKGRVGPEWVSEHFIRQLRTLVERDVPIFLLYGDEDAYYEDFRRARSGPLGSLIHQAGSKIEIQTLPGRVHGFTRLSIQDAVLDQVASWLQAGGADIHPAASQVAEGAGYPHELQLD
jgi:pimeloyl-ACP methyl ester carboxylesterase